MTRSIRATCENRILEDLAAIEGLMALRQVGSQVSA
jgi:hypothetical protein